MILGLFRLLEAVFCCLPDRFSRAVGICLGFIYGHVVRYHRTDAFEALERSFPEKSKQEIRGIVNRMYLNFGMNVVETMRLTCVPDKFIAKKTDIANVERADEALARGRGLLVLTAHVGNWETLCTVMPKIGYPVTAVAKAIKNKPLNDYIKESRARFGLEILPPHGSIKDCVRALKKNRTVALMLDQNVIRREGEFVDFFGKPACTTLGLAYLSVMTGAPVLPVFALRQPDHTHEIVMLPLIEPPESKDRNCLIAATQQYTRILEDIVRKNPDQWIWIHRRWRTEPGPDEQA